MTARFAPDEPRLSLHFLCSLLVHAAALMAFLALPIYEGSINAGLSSALFVSLVKQPDPTGKAPATGGNQPEFNGPDGEATEETPGMIVDKKVLPSERLLTGTAGFNDAPAYSEIENTGTLPLDVAKEREIQNQVKEELPASAESPEGEEMAKEDALPPAGRKHEDARKETSGILSSEVTAGERNQSEAFDIVKQEKTSETVETPNKNRIAPAAADKGIPVPQQDIVHKPETPTRPKELAPPPGDIVKQENPPEIAEVLNKNRAAPAAVDRKIPVPPQVAVHREDAQVRPKILEPATESERAVPVTKDVGMAKQVDNGEATPPPGTAGIKGAERDSAADAVFSSAGRNFDAVHAPQIRSTEPSREMSFVPDIVNSPLQEPSLANPKEKTIRKQKAIFNQAKARQERTETSGLSVHPGVKGVTEAVGNEGKKSQGKQPPPDGKTASLVLRHDEILRDKRPDKPAGFYPDPIWEITPLAAIEAAIAGGKPARTERPDSLRSIPGTKEPRVKTAGGEAATVRAGAMEKGKTNTLSPAPPLTTASEDYSHRELPEMKTVADSPAHGFKIGSTTISQTPAASSLDPSPGFNPRSSFLPALEQGGFSATKAPVGTVQPGAGVSSSRQQPSSTAEAVLKTEIEQKDKGKEEPVFGVPVSESFLHKDVKVTVSSARGDHTFWVKLRLKAYPDSRGKDARGKGKVLELHESGWAAHEGKDRKIFSIAKAERGTYTFVIGNRGLNATADADIVISLYEGDKRARTKTYEAVQFKPGTVKTFRCILPDGIFWDDEDRFSGSIEDSDSVTKFNYDTGLVWKEEKESEPDGADIVTEIQ